MTKGFRAWLCIGAWSAAAAGWAQGTGGVPDDAPVRLPWVEVAALLAKAEKTRTSPAPVPFALGTAAAEGEVSQRTLAVRLSISVRLLDDAWCAVPLWRSGATLRRATLDGKPAAFSLDGDQWVLVARGRGEHVLKAELSLPLGTTGSQANIPFVTPVPVSWRLALPGTDARIEPAIRQSVKVRAATVVLEALTPPTGAVQIDWSAERGTAVPARLTVESLTLVTFQEGTVPGRAQFSFEIAGGQRDRLSIWLPGDLEILSAQAAELSSWAVEAADGGKRLVAHFRRPQRGHVELDLSFELPKPQETATLPRLAAEEATEQHAYVGASTESPMAMEPVDVTGGEAIDAKRLPLHLLRGVSAPIALAYRHDGAHFVAHVRIDRHATVALAQATIDAAYFTTVLTDDGEEVVKATFLVKNNLRPYLGVTLPPDATLWAAFVSGEAVNPASQGAKLLLPLVKSREVGEGDTLAFHTVTAGYTLGDIALQYYHDASKWKLIQAGNGDVLGGRSSAQVGQRLRIPRMMGPAGADLETAFPVEVVYSRPAAKAGMLGGLSFEGPVAELEVMKLVWTVYLPSRLDPLKFSGNLTQTSYVRYGLGRRLNQLLHGPLAVATPGLAISSAYAGDASLRHRFAQMDEVKEAPMSHPREVLPLVGRGYVFKKFLTEKDQPRIEAAYVDRKLERPFRWLAFALSLLGGLGLVRALSRGDPRSVQRGVWLALGVAVLVLAGGHFVLGTHARAAVGGLLGGWLWLIYRISVRPTGMGAGQRVLARGVQVCNALAFGLVLAAGFGPGTGVIALACAVLGIWFLRRKTGQLAGAVAALALLVALPARAEDTPRGAEITVPFGKLKELLGLDKVPAAPPRDYSVLSARYQARVSGDTVDVDGELEVELHGDKWVQIPLVAASEAVTRAALDGASIGVGTAGGAAVAVFKGAGHHQLKLSFGVPVREQGLATLALVPGVTSSLAVHLPAGGLEPELTGASDVLVSGPDITGWVGPDGAVTLRWSAEPQAAPQPGRTEAELRMTARTLQIVSVDEHRTYALVRYRIQRGSSNQFSVTLPDDVDLLDVQGNGIQQHQVASVDGKRVLGITTATSVRDEFELSFAYEWRSLAEAKPLPTFSVRGVRSETGTLGIEASQSTEIQLSDVTGAAAIDVRAAPELFQHTDKPIVHAIRYLQQPYSVRLQLLQHPEVELETATVDEAKYTTVVAQDGRAISQGVFKIRNARRPFLGVTLPPSSEVQSVLIGGSPAKPVRDAKGNLLLPLMRSPSTEREMRQFEVELVYLTHGPDGARAVDLKSALPMVDLRISKVSWDLYLPPGNGVTHRPLTEAASDSMQWATAPRAALAAFAHVTHGGSEALASGGILPVRFNLPTHGEPERFFAYYLPAAVAPHFDVSYAPTALHPALQALGAIALIGAVIVLVGLARRRTQAR